MKTPEHLRPVGRAQRGLRSLLHALLLLLGLVAGACLDPKSDDLPRATDDDDSAGVPPAGTGPTGASGTPGGGGGAGTSNTDAEGAGGSGGSAGGGNSTPEEDAGASQDAGSDLGDTETGAGDAGTD